jgi:hypothetical protein
MGRCRPLSTDEIESMKAHCLCPRDRAILSFFERTGYRAAETASLKVKDIWVVSLSYLDESLQAQETGVPIGRVDQ